MVGEGGEACGGGRNPAPPTSAHPTRPTNNPGAAITPILKANIAAEARLLTDEAGVYRQMQLHFASHGTTAHTAGQCVDPANPEIHSNTIEDCFSIFKRGMRGIFQYCSEQHLHRYLAEFDFRYTNRIANSVNDVERADVALAGVRGKRLTYGSARRKS